MFVLLHWWNTTVTLLKKTFLPLAQNTPLLVVNILISIIEKKWIEIMYNLTLEK